nr:class I SAM-dependent methyltransferase [uncultured Pseudodesulfovibrio sp.]
MSDTTAGTLYEKYYESSASFFKYPNEFIVKGFYSFINRDPYAGPSVSTGRALDFAYGSGSNSVFLIQQGYETHGVEVASSAHQLLVENLRWHGLSEKLATPFVTIDEAWKKLPFEDNFFNLAIANHVLYYYFTPEAWNHVTSELFRCLAPGGMLLLSLMAPEHPTCVEATPLGDGIYQTPKGALAGQTFRGIKSLDEVKTLLPDFEEVSRGRMQEEWQGSGGQDIWLYCARKPLND